jgi:O-methyltransferase involved in polyketide biosynthesis
MDDRELIPMPEIRRQVAQIEHHADARLVHGRVQPDGLASNGVTQKLHVDLSGAPQTMLATFYAKALDADLPKPILGDRFAKEIVERIDYDWKKTAITPANSPSVTTRSAHFDRWARQFLAVTPEAVVLHLGCGLDARFLRLAPGPGVEWYDVDYPDVAQLRHQLYPTRDHYHLIAASVTDPGWFADIPRDRPILMIGEGLTMYLTRDDGVALLRRVVEHAPSGELQFDAFNRLGIRSQWMNTVVRRSGATLHWGIDGPDDILDAVPGVRLLAWDSPFDDAVFTEVAWYYRLMAAVMRPVSALRYMAQYHRYAF